MRKRSGIVVETTRPKTLSKLITAPKAKLDTDKYLGSSPGDSITGDVNSTAPATNGIEIDPLNPEITDNIGSGQTLYQRLTLASGQYCPIYYPSFYRRVWFNGLEAFEDQHFHVDLSNGCIVPNSNLPSTEIVTASYVKA